MNIAATFTAPEAAMKARADITIDVGLTDNDGTHYEGEAYFLVGGGFELPDEGPRFWAADVEFIGAVLFGSDDGKIKVIHSHEAAPWNWIEEANEIAEQDFAEQYADDY